MRCLQPALLLPPAIILASTILVACKQTHEVSAPDRKTVPATRSENAVDPYQTITFDAGRDLIGTRVPALSFKTIDGNAVRLGAPQAARLL